MNLLWNWRRALMRQRFWSWRKLNLRNNMPKRPRNAMRLSPRLRMSTRKGSMRLSRSSYYSSKGPRTLHICRTKTSILISSETTRKSTKVRLWCWSRDWKSAKENLSKYVTSRKRLSATGKSKRTIWWRHIKVCESHTQPSCSASL